jgi:hypothetical protein
MMAVCVSAKTFNSTSSRIRAVWVSVEPNIRWHYEVLLWSSQSDVCKILHFKHHVSVVLPVEHNEKLCPIVPLFEAGTILLSKMFCHFMQ